MIVTDLSNIEHQIPMTPGLIKAIDFLRRPGIHSLADGKVEIDGDRLFALVQRYETAITDPLKFESHRKYIDVQYIGSGEEIIGWAPIAYMTITDAYDANKDVCFGTVGRENITPVYLRAGLLAVLYPEDSHATKLASGMPSSVMKIVVKVAV